MRKEGASVTAKDIGNYMDARVSKIKRISGGVVFVNSIPKNPVSGPLQRVIQSNGARGLTRTEFQSGKILRKVLREQASAELADSRTTVARL